MIKIDLNSGTLLTREVLFTELKDDFSGIYTVKLFGWGPGKSIMVKKSFFVGARVLIRPTKILVFGTFPGYLASGLFAGLFFALLLRKSWKNIEKEVADHITQKYLL